VMLSNEGVAADEVVEESESRYDERDVLDAITDRRDWLI
jgi:hypothetical protein